MSFADNGDRDRSPEELASQVRNLETEVSALRRRLAATPDSSRTAEARLRELERSLSATTAQNERLAQTLRDAREQITKLHEEVDRLAEPPAGYGVFLARHADDTVDVFTGGRKLRVTVSPTVDLETLVRGQEVMLNDAMNVVRACAFEQVGEVSMVKELLSDGQRALVIGNGDEERVVRLAQPLLEGPLRVGDSLLVDQRSGFAYERVPKSEVSTLR